MYLAMVFFFGVLSLGVAMPLGAFGAHLFVGVFAGLLNFDTGANSIPTYVLALEVGADLTSFSDLTARAGRTYWYRARAFNDQGSSRLSNLARVRELASLIHLAKFTGAPAARAEELVARIAAAVEGVSDLGWQGNRDCQQLIL